MVYSNLSTSEHNLFTDKTVKQIKDILHRHADKTIGFTASAFDLLHAGHALMLKDAKTKCDVLVIALHTDPTINRDSKNKPVLDYTERKIMVESVRYVDEIIEYATEEDLLHILQTLDPDVRILGSDWKDKPYTGYELPIPVYFHHRDHDYSTTKLRERVFEAELARRKECFECRYCGCDAANKV